MANFASDDYYAQRESNTFGAKKRRIFVNCVQLANSSFGCKAREVEGKLKKLQIQLMEQGFSWYPTFALSEEAEVRRHLQQAVDAKKKTAAVFGPLAARILQILAQCKERKKSTL